MEHLRGYWYHLLGRAKFGKKKFSRKLVTDVKLILEHPLLEILNALKCGIWRFCKHLDLCVCYSEKCSGLEIHL